MSPSVYVTTRDAKTGKRYVVRFRLGGRGFPLIHAGSFRTMKEARLRRDFVAGELAAGRDPMIALRALAQAPPEPVTFRELTERWLDARVDLSAKSLRTYRSILSTAVGDLGDRDPGSLTFSDFQEWVATNAGLKKATLSLCRTMHRQVLDFAGVDPNPARDRRIRLPWEEQEEINPPTAKQLLVLLKQLRRRYVLPVVTLEQTGMRLNELVGLPWGDVDVYGLRFRLRASSTKTARARWVQVPDWLMDAIADTCPLEDRTADRRVFPGIVGASLRNAMAAACVTAGIPHFHPHDLRHRRISLWHGQSIPWREIADRVGQTRPSITLDIYSHVMPLDELQADELEPLLAENP